MNFYYIQIKRKYHLINEFQICRSKIVETRNKRVLNIPLLNLIN